MSRTLSGIQAHAASDDRNNRTGYVEVFARIDWIKGDQLAFARITPREARTLARRLLEAADRAEGQS